MPYAGDESAIPVAPRVLRPPVPTLFYNQAAQISGAERVLLTILEHLAPNEPPLLLCAASGPLLDEACRMGMPVLPVSPLVLGRTRNPILLARFLLDARRPIRDLAWAIRHHRPRLVYANTLRSGLVATAALHSVRPRPRLVVHLHDGVPDGLLDRLAARVVGRSADTLIAVSGYVAQRFAAEAGKVRVLHNAIDPDRYRCDPRGAESLRQRLGIPPDAPLLAVVGQITPWKGQREALEAFAALRVALPTTHLLLAGSVKFTGRHRRYDTEAYAQELVARAQQPDLAGFVHLAGEVGDVRAVYSAATVLLVPSWHEAFAMVILEAMAIGCPVIATAAGGNGEIITRGVDGWLVPAHDPAALAGAAHGLLCDAPRQRQLAANARQTIEERCDVRPYMVRLRQILESTRTL